MTLIKQLYNKLLQYLKEPTVQNKDTFVYTEEQLMARLKFFIGICLSLTLFGIVFVVLYSLIFVTQPLNAISPIDQKFFELIVPIATFLTGTLSGIMLAGTSKEDKEAMLAALKMANENFEATKKVMSAPPPAQKVEPTLSPTATPAASQSAQVVVGFGGKPAPAPAPAQVKTSYVPGPGSMPFKLANGKAAVFEPYPNQADLDMARKVKAPTQRVNVAGQNRQINAYVYELDDVTYVVAQPGQL